jgi:predicted kinase
MTKSKLLLLNGFAGAGKTTIAKKYISEHPMAMVIEGDELIVNIGDWFAHDDEARELVFALIKAMLRVYLASGHDVVLPYLVTDVEEVQEFELLASELGAEFYEVVLHNDRHEAIARLLKRGTWGEVGQPPLTNQDLPIIEGLMTKMEEELEKRPNIIKIDIKEGDPNDTYSRLMGHLAS